MKKLVINLLICAIVASGWGNSTLYLAAVAALVCLCLLWTEKLIIKAFIFIFLVAVFWDFSIAFCSSLVGFLLIISGYKREGSSFLGSQLFFLISPFIQLPLFIIHPLSSICLYLTLLLISYRLRKASIPFTKIPVLLYGSILIYLSSLSWSLNPASSLTIPRGYQIGSSISKFASIDSSAQGKIVYNNNEYKKICPTGTLYLDHDAKTQWDVGNVSQQRPWSANMPVGSELVRMAIFKDGNWICNKGSFLRCDEARFIGGLFQDNAVKPLIICHKDHLILGDSDFVVDCLAPYQRHFISYLTGSDSFSRTFHAICGLCLVVSCFWNIPAFICLLGLYHILLLCLPFSGDVRYVGKAHKWAHTDLGEGVVRFLQQRGKNVIFGCKDTKLLVIGEGHSSTLKDESVVILEPGAEVIIHGSSYKADTVPLGQAQNITDARRLIVNGKVTNLSKLTVEKVLIIATGTPTAQSEELIWPF